MQMLLLPVLLAAFLATHVLPEHGKLNTQWILLMLGVGSFVGVSLAVLVWTLTEDAKPPTWHKGVCVSVCVCVCVCVNVCGVCCMFRCRCLCRCVSVCSGYLLWSSSFTCILVYMCPRTATYVSAYRYVFCGVRRRGPLHLHA